MDEKDSVETEESYSYPVQNAEFTPHPFPSGGSEGTSGGRLPHSIRALKDSQDSQNSPRTIVVCLDGTGDQFDNDNSNVVHFVSCLRKHTPSEQVVYYQSGIGTYTKGGLQRGFSAALDMAVGSGLGIHIKDAYKFLMQNYHAGDKICLFGFSRGAYTVRCLAGMLHKVGLLPASNTSQIEFAYNFYRDDTKAGWDMSDDFKRTFCTDVNVYFLGIWDCVASVGFFPRKLPFSKSPTNNNRYFRHAMALDEHRAKFKVCHWQHQDPAAAECNLKRRETIDNTPIAKVKRNIRDFGKGKPRMATTIESDRNHHLPSLEEISEKKGKEQDELEALFEAQDEKRHQRVESDGLEVWFMGAHADVGGGAVANDSRHMLARIPLRWMIRQCFECNTGILFSTIALAKQGLDVHTLYPIYRNPTKAISGPPPTLLEKYEKKKLAPIWRRSTFLAIDTGEDPVEEVTIPESLGYVLPSEADEDWFDARAGVHDQLNEAKSWWILELFWPVKVRVLAKGGEGWEKKVRFNMGRHRAVREGEPKMHWTVKHMSDAGEYRLRARFDKTTTWQEVV
ncbi:hypothetical protein EJ08DRAFT_258111 [Tothia fuscella]|uniref:T6SS Phospholipase effector Tle1-like catalytic domain-containing protein n=1 Tax=Tothia fuscella TaxID=1048955 RepID=A0A9P4NRC6_9PEZI|nr:hypothetical protein EJ08DRAFT_258111 [Tothia fuscella]